MTRTGFYRLTLAAALSFGLVFAACGDAHDTADKRSETNDPEQAGINSQATVPSATDTSQSTAPPNTANTMDDASIMGRMMATDEMEMSMGNMGRMKAQNAEVKALAKMIEDDHTKMLTQAEELTSRLALNPVMPSPSDPAIEQTMVALGKASGPAFDSMFVALNIQGHEKTLADLAAMQPAASKQEIKDLIAAAIPVIQKHLDRARQIQGTIGKGHSGNVSGAVR